MYIANLRIVNYRNFTDFSIKLKPLTLIIGENNIGKSNLLDSIGLIFSQDVSFFRKRVLEISDFNHDCMVNFKRQILDHSIPAENIVYPEIKVTATLIDWNTEQESVVADWYSNAELSEVTLTYEFTPVASFDRVGEIRHQREFIDGVKTKMGEAVFNAIGEKEKLDLINFPISKYYYSIFGGSQRDTQANTYHLNQMKFELLDALRDAETELVASHSGRLLFRILNSKDEADYQDLKTQLLGLQKAIDENIALRTLKQGISDQLDKISLNTEGGTNDVNFIFALPNIDDLLKKISLIYGANPIKIERNGTGRNNLLFISLILSYIEDVTRAQSSYFRVVGLEEPEAHLHPNLQDHLAANLEGLLKVSEGEQIRKDIQILLTSHSTYITTKIKHENTVVIYGNNGSIRPYYVFEGFPDTAQGRKNRKYLNKYLDAANTNLFYSRRIILVEGISEKLLIPEFFKLYKSQTLEQASCCIVNVNGLAFANFLEVIKDGYFIKCIVFTDSDEGTSVENRGVTLVTEYSSVPQVRIQITSQSTFEKDVIDANKTGTGKTILIKVLKTTRPVVGKSYEEGLKGGDIVVEDFFALIVSYKSDFAYNLLVELTENSTGFIIPEYIKTGFDFILS